MNSSAVRPMNSNSVSQHQSFARCSSAHSGSCITRSSIYGDYGSHWSFSVRLSSDVHKYFSGGSRGWDDSELRNLAISSVLSLKDVKKSFNLKERSSPVFPVNLNSCFRGLLSQLFHDAASVEGKIKQLTVEDEPLAGEFEVFPSSNKSGKNLVPMKGYIMQSFKDSGSTPVLTEVLEESINARALAEIAILDLVSAIPSLRALRTLPYFDTLQSNPAQAPKVACPQHDEDTPTRWAALQGRGTNRVQVVTSEDLGSADALASWLSVRLPSGIDKWGVTPGTKRVLNLWMELKDGEIILEDAHPPRRTVHVASVKIQNKAGLMLVEGHQELADGSIRHRNRPLSEKMRPGENVEEACFRGIFEELGSQLGARSRVRILGGSYRLKQEERESRSYPGLLTFYVVHSMDAVIEDLPETGFCTVEDEMLGQKAPDTVVISRAGPGTFCKGTAVGVKKHFWRWVPQAS